MATQVTNYKCPSCTGPLHFDSDTGMLVCDYCESKFTVAEMEAQYAQKNEKAEEAFQEAEQKAEQRKKKQAESGSNSETWDESRLNTDWGEDGARMRAYGCPDCGAQIICEETTAATSCPYCGNPTIVPGQFADELKPDYIIPFRMSKEKAIEALRKHYKGKRLLPKKFSEENHLEEIKGIYVPFWLFDGEVDAQASYDAEIVTVHETSHERVTTTRVFDVRRKGKVKFSRIPTDASKKMHDALMDSIEPYDYSDLKPFAVSYLPGYYADKYDVSVQDCTERADSRAKRTAQAALKHSVSGYTVAVERNADFTIKRGRVQYALLPVWILSTKWNGESYLFAMNGQTGKLVGNMPMDKGRYWKWRLLYSGIIGMASFLICNILGILL